MRFTTLILITSFYNLYRCINHWELKDDKIVAKIDSPFHLREPDNLVTFLDQIQLNDFVEHSYVKLIRKREDFTEHLSFSMEFGETLIEQAKCAMDTYLLEKKMSYLKITPELFKRLEISHHLKSEATFASEEEPFCGVYAKIPYNDGDFEYLDVFKASKSSRIVSEEDEKNPDGVGIVRILALQGLHKDPNSWKYHTLASYYWRFKGNGTKALECARIGVSLAPINKKDIPLLSLGTILFRMNRLAEADLILSKAVALASEVAENHLVLATTLASKHDFERSLFHFDEAEQLDPSILRRTHQVRTFISCLQSFNKKASKMYSYVEYMKNELKEFKKLKKHITQKHENIVQHQLPLTARYQNSKAINSDLHKRGQYCSTRTSATGEATLFCDFYSDMQMRLESKDIDIDTLEREFKSKTESILSPVSQLKTSKTQVVPLLPSKSEIH